MSAPITITRILFALLPMARRLAEAMRKDSDGGKRITESELLEILLGEVPGLIDRLDRSDG